MEGCGSGVRGRKIAPDRVLPGSIQSSAVLNIYRCTRAGARKVQPAAAEQLLLLAVALSVGMVFLLKCDLYDLFTARPPSGLQRIFKYHILLF